MVTQRDPRSPLPGWDPLPEIEDFGEAIAKVQCQLIILSDLAPTGAWREIPLLCRYWENRYALSLELYWLLTEQLGTCVKNYSKVRKR